MGTLLSIGAGICLGAACGFRVFVPFLIMSVAARAGVFDPTERFEWIASTPALVILITASVVEIAAYAVPWVDTILDTLATPVAVVAGTLASAAVIGDFPGVVNWVIALVVGGGIAGAVQGGTVAARGTSTVTTAGFANPLVSLGELGGAIGAALLGILLPVVGAVLIVGLLVLLLRRVFRRSRARRAPASRP
jgi:hypothetical protein